MPAEIRAERDRSVSLCGRCAEPAHTSVSVSIYVALDAVDYNVHVAHREVFGTAPREQRRKVVTPNNVSSTARRTAILRGAHDERNG